MKVLHISWMKRSDGELGGVEKFGSYLERALRESDHACTILAWSDYPARRSCANLSNPDKALVLGSWAESELDFDVAVSDGYWGLGITSRPIVPVVHGTWAQFHLNMGTSPWTNAEVRAQHDAFTAPNTFPVACSPAAAKELEAHHKVKPAATILHGVDLQDFQPRDGWAEHEPVVLHAASNAKKGSDLVPAIARSLGAGFRVRYLNAKAGEEADAFRQGDIFLHPSKHEGNAYALLEALATALPVVTTAVGLFEGVPDGTVGRVLSIRTTVSQWAQAVREIWADRERYHRYSLEARKLAEEIADFRTFRTRWVNFLEGLL